MKTDNSTATARHYTYDTTHIDDAASEPYQSTQYKQFKFQLFRIRENNFKLKAIEM